MYRKMARSVRKRGEREARFCVRGEDKSISEKQSMMEVT
jgi:hypothetical protein